MSFQAKLQVYIDVLCERMGLKDWQVKFEDVPIVSGDVLAQIFIIEPYRAATLHVALNFDQFDAQHQRRILTHELCHVLTERLVNTIDVYKGTLGAGESRIHGKMVNEANEYAVEAFAQVIAPFMPLPRLGKR